MQWVTRSPRLLIVGFTVALLIIPIASGAAIGQHSGTADTSPSDIPPAELDHFGHGTPFLVQQEPAPVAEATQMDELDEVQPIESLFQLSTADSVPKNQQVDRSVVDISREAQVKSNTPITLNETLENQSDVIQITALSQQEIAAIYETIYGNKSPNWVPPVPQTSIDTETYLYMWAGMEELDQINDTEPIADEFTVFDLLLQDAVTVDQAQATPPDHAVRWNQAEPDRFPSRGRNTSAYPPGTNRTNTLLTKDAYFTLIDVVPSTRLHHPDGERHIIPQEGSVFVATDFRTELPKTTDRSVGDPDVRHTYEYNSHRYTPVNVTLIESSRSTTELKAENVTISSAGYVPYEDAGTAAGTTVTLRANTTLKLTVTEIREEYQCANENCTSKEWVATGEKTITHNVTLADTIEVTPQEPPRAAIELRRAPNGSYIRVKNAPKYWGGIEHPAIENGSVSSHVGFFTTRDRKWDQIVYASKRGTTPPQYHPFTPVQTHAAPLYNGTAVRSPDPEFRDKATIYNQTTSSDVPYADVPRNVNLTTTTGQSTARRVTATSVYLPSDEVEAPVVNSLISNRPIDATTVTRPPSRTPNLTASSQPVENDSGATVDQYRVTVRLTDPETGEPIQTKGTTRAIRINGEHEVNTNESGYASYVTSESTRTPTGFYILYDPGLPFQQEHHYEEVSTGATNAAGLRFGPLASIIVFDIVLPIFYLILPLVTIGTIAYVGINGKLPPIPRFW